MKSGLISCCLLSLAVAPFCLSAQPLLYCSEGSPSILNPQLATDGTTFDVTRNIYSKLVKFKPGALSITTDLATDWQISKDGTEYTFQLRKGVKFHQRNWFEPTREFNADDVLFSFQRQWHKAHPYHTTGGGSYEYFSSMQMSKVIKKIDKIDPHEIKITLYRPDATFLNTLAMDFMSILSAEYGAKLAAKDQQAAIDHLPVGTGPFAFKSYQRDQLLRLVKHPEYYGEPAKVTGIIFLITTDPAVRMQKIRAGECHIVSLPALIDLKRARQIKTLRVQEKSALNIGYLAMNTQKKPYGDKRVRQAIHYALNRQAYIEAIYLGYATVADGPIPNGVLAGKPPFKRVPYDPIKAKQLLAQAGYPRGFETELWTLPVTRPYNPNGKRLGEMMQADLSKVGIRAKLVTYDWPTYLAKSRHGAHELLQLGWTSDNGDPDSFLNGLLTCSGVEGGSNRARWCQPSFDHLVTEARTFSNQDHRQAAYEELARMYNDDLPWVALAHSKMFAIHRANVMGFQMDPLGRNSLVEVTIVDSE